MIDSEASIHVCKATGPPAVKIREINLRSCRRELNPRHQHDERASYPLGHRGSVFHYAFKNLHFYLPMFLWGVFARGVVIIYYRNSRWTLLQANATMS